MSNEDDCKCRDPRNAHVSTCPAAREDRRDYARQSPRPTLTDLAARWQNGEEEARDRLVGMLENSHRFDARDRMALAYLLTRGK